MHYVKLMPDIYFESTERDGCLYYLSENKVKYLSPVQNKIFASLTVENASLEETAERYGSGVDELLSELDDNGDIYIYDRNVYTEQAKKTSPLEIRGFFETPPQYRNIYIQVTDKCGMDCSVCQSEKTNHSCRSCFRWTGSSSSAELEHDDFINAVAQLSGLKKYAVVFSGGDPLLNTGKILDAVEELKKSSQICDIWIKTPVSTMPDDGFIDKCRQLGVGFDIVFIGDSKEVCTVMTGGSEAYERAEKLLFLCREKGVDNKVSYLVPGDHRTDYYDNCAELPPENGEYASTLTLEEMKTKSVSDIEDLKRYDTCFNSTLALSLNGDLRACPSMDIVYGNLRENKLYEIFRKDEMEKYRRTSKDRISACSKCAMKYVCSSDCTKINIEREKCCYEPDNG